MSCKFVLELRIRFTSFDIDRSSNPARLHFSFAIAYYTFITSYKATENSNGFIAIGFLVAQQYQMSVWVTHVGTTCLHDQNRIKSVVELKKIPPHPPSYVVMSCYYHHHHYQSPFPTKSCLLFEMPQINQH